MHTLRLDGFQWDHATHDDTFVQLLLRHFPRMKYFYHAHMARVSNRTMLDVIRTWNSERTFGQCSFGVYPRFVDDAFIQQLLPLTKPFVHLDNLQQWQGWESRYLTMLLSCGTPWQAVYWSYDGHVECVPKGYHMALNFLVFLDNRAMLPFGRTSLSRMTLSVRSCAPVIVFACLFSLHTMKERYRLGRDRIVARSDMQNA